MRNIGWLFPGHIIGAGDDTSSALNAEIAEKGGFSGDNR
jgi:hypothetical protein